MTKTKCLNIDLLKFLLIAFCFCFVLHFIDKTPSDSERETTLLEQLLRLAEERNLAELPPPGSGIPGSIDLN